MTKPYGDNKYPTYPPRFPESSYFQKHCYFHLRAFIIVKSANSLIIGNPFNWSPSLIVQNHVLNSMGFWVRNEAQRSSEGPIALSG